VIGCSASHDFEFDLSRDFQVVGSSTHYVLSQNVSATDVSSDFNTYKSDISDVQVVSAKYLISAFTGPSSQRIDSASLKCGATTDSVATTLIAAMNNVNLLSVAAVDQDLPLNDAGKTTLKNLIRNDPNAAKLSFAGFSNEGPMNFTVTFKIHMKVTYTKSLL